MRSLLLCLAGVLPALLIAQPIPVTFSITTTADTTRISPYVYGANTFTVDNGSGITARRMGGNRITGYNWENNASNAGSDYFHSSDNFLTWAAGIPDNQANIPGIVLTDFHDHSLALGTYSLVTLPAAGYVSRDKNGTVTQGQTAPSYRWRAVVNRKQGPLSLTPDTSDGFVYVDEEVNFLVHRYGPASGPQGVRGYAVDNEPALWPSTHPRIHPDTSRCLELITKVTGVAHAVKSVDATAEVFGGVFYGFGAYYQFQWAPDWQQFSSYENYAAALLDRMQDSSQAYGRRLMDVLDMHWYPDLYTPVYNENTDSVTVYHRMQVPRTLWDSTYVENGWIGQWFHPQSAAIIRRTQRLINQYNPGTKLAITEFSYGATGHISGGIAMADVLGIVGREGVYFASPWIDITGYVGAAYRMFRNYDGTGGCYGDINVRATTSDRVNAPAYASRDSNDPARLHVIAINKSFSRSLQGTFTVASPVTYTSASVYGMTGSGPVVQSMPGIANITGNTFSYSIPPLSVVHFILGGTTGIAAAGETPARFGLDQNYPNPFNPSTRMRFHLPQSMHVHLDVYDLLGRHVATIVDGFMTAGSHDVLFDARNLSSGTYFCRLQSGFSSDIIRIVLMR